MPYDRNADLPRSIRDSLPKDAQTIDRKAFDNAWEQYRQRDMRRAGSSREETSRRAVAAGFRARGVSHVSRVQPESKTNATAETCARSVRAAETQKVE